MTLREGDDPPLPEYLRPYLQGGKKLFDEEAVGEIEFSGGTYQIQVQDTVYEPESYPWAFLQLDNRGLIKDAFCSCESVGDADGCPHIVAGYFRVFNHHKKPLHIRFEESIWNQIGVYLAEKYGYDCTRIEDTDFDITFLTDAAKQHYQNLIQQRKRETEETSLKFSNLSEEEIELWKEGRPSPKLQYELSLWSDLAKWWMTMQDRGDVYEVQFTEQPKRLPTAMDVSFRELCFTLPLNPKLLVLLVPYLNHVKSSIPVHSLPEDEISKITYEPAKGAFLVHGIGEGAKKPEKLEKAISLGGWIYLPGEGFFAAEAHSLLQRKVIDGDAVSELFHEHFHLVKQFLEGYELHETPISPKYSLKFDKNWNLHVEMYLFHKGDLKDPESRTFDDWVFVPKVGFYHIQNQLFTELSQVVPAQDISDFVTTHRSLLNGIDGFQTHLSNIEAQVDYNVDGEGRLNFTRVLLDGNEKHLKDFGFWIYMQGQGFYSKSQSSASLPFRPGMTLTKDQVPLFIRMNEEELKILPRFFANRSPVSRGGLKVSLTAKEGLCIQPVYYFHDDVDANSVLFYDDYTFQQGLGFRELPPDSRLPADFQREVNVPASETEQFMETTYPSIKPFILDLQKEIQVPDHMQIVVTELKKEGDDFLAKLKGVTELGKVSITQLWWLRRKKRKHAFSPAGLIPLDHPNLAWLKWLSPKQVDRRSNTVRLTVFELLRLEALFPLVYADKEAEKEIVELTSFKLSEEPDLEGLNSSLRPYQLLGVRWLWFLYRHSMSGLLCDDMGLGKTHQTMALITAITNYCRGEKKKFLVICPTSVIYHWQEKLEKFLPKMKVYTFHGLNRSLEGFEQDGDILLTSYGIWRNEKETLEKMEFELAVFDEVQLAKNHQSRLYASLQSAKAKMRLGLTGTPIENQLRELKALFDLVLPGYMLTDADFQSYFVRPIERDSNIQRRKLLQKLIKPFVMRRRKEEVLQDLPEKIEELIHCEMTPAQSELYETVLRASRERIVSEIADGKNPIPYIHIFALLSHLKMICDHPAVFHKTPWEYRKYDSGKWELFLELLEEARDSRQKIVVFSQYLGMLDIIEEHLKEHNIGYATIRGATQNRAEQLMKFKDDPACEVFVASLQAAGLGIDLTAASVVIHYDRWWNAARENQATDRVHRIGQKRGVQVFKLVTKDSFEERIDKLITKKGDLMEEVIGVDDHQVLKSFSREELLELLQIKT